MNRATRWWPAGAAMLIMTALVVLCALTPTAPTYLAPLPSPLRTTGIDHRGTEETPKRSIFPQPSATTDVATLQATPRLPVLVGVAGGRSTRVALLKQADGKTVRAHAGEVVDGWTVRSITLRVVIIGNAHGDEQLVLSEPKQ